MIGDVGKRHPVSGQRSGFTLLEVVVALMIGGLAVSTAAALLLGIADRADEVRSWSATIDRDANAERLLRALADNMATGMDARSVLKGDEREVRFQSWCEGANGRGEPCSVRLHYDQQKDGRCLTLELTSLDSRDEARARPVRLWCGFTTGGFLYLIDAAGGGSWTQRWSVASPPPALAAVMDTDTLILPIP